MRDFVAALGLLFAIEGICLAAFPATAKRAVANLLTAPDAPLRLAGLLSALVGVGLVWLVRG